MHVFNSVASASVAVAFWLFLAVCAVAGMRYDLRKRQLAMDSLRAAIERGQALEPAVVEKILALQSEKDADAPEDLRPYLQIGGIITIAVGIGVLIAGGLIGLQFPVARLPLLGAGALVVCIGAGLLLSSRALSHHPPRRGPPDSVA